MKPKFFSKPINFRNWLEKNHSTKTELLVGFHKKDSGKPSITWPESVDEALCFGWIDGIRKSLNEESYTIRFTPRKEKSHWSAVNIKRFTALKKSGLIHSSGLRAFERMESKNSRKASFEQEKITLGETFEAKIKANKKAWAFFQKLAPSYKKASVWWVISAKREETQWRRLNILIKSSGAQEKIPQLQISKKK
ncbi:MAG: YdeI/OmpD-associated family protein [Cyclobacteriaceae bacterium]